MILRKIIKRNNGQVMMIVVMVLSGVMIGSMAISGTLTARQIRQSADAGSSSKTIFAADAGLEWALYKFWKDVDDDYKCYKSSTFDDCEGMVCDEFPIFELLNGSKVMLETTCDFLYESGNNNFYEISSTGRIDKSSYTFTQVFFARKLSY